MDKCKLLSKRGIHCCMLSLAFHFFSPLKPLSQIKPRSLSWTLGDPRSKIYVTSPPKMATFTANRNVCKWLEILHFILE